MTLLNNWLWWIISGAFLGSGLLYPKVWILGIIGGIIFVILLRKEENLYKDLLGAWISWTIKVSFALSYGLTVYPISWLPENLKGGELFVLVTYWLISSLFVGLGGPLVVIFYRLVRKFLSKNNFIIHFLIAIFFIIGEVFGSFAYSFFAIGPGGGLNIYLSLGYSGYLLAEHEFLLPLAAIAGVYGLSFLFGLSVSFFAFWVKEKKLLPYIMLCVLVVYLTSFVSFSHQEINNTQETYDIAVIETNFLSWMNFSEEGIQQISENLEAAVTEALNRGFEYVVLPEASGYFNQANFPAMNIALFDFIHKNSNKAIIIDSGEAMDGEKKVVQAFIYDGLNKTFFEAQKYYLVPQGEFLSYAFLWMSKLFGYGEEIKNLENLDYKAFYEVGSKVSQSEFPSNIPGVLFCFESVSPLGAYKLMRERENVPFLVHPISHSWFYSPYTLWHQQDMMLKVQAVWNKTYIVSSANEAESLVVTPEGDIYIGEVVAEGNLWRIRKVSIPVQ